MMCRRSFILTNCACIIFALLFEFSRVGWGESKTLQQWQRTNDIFQVRLSQNSVPGIPLNRYEQVLESAPVGAKNWSRVIVMPLNEQNKISFDGVSFFGNKICCVCAGSKLIMTTDGGSSWFEHEFPAGRLKKVEVLDDGQGMLWMDAGTGNGESTRIIYRTLSYGKFWYRIR